jgi:hypothetical protein
MNPDISELERRMVAAAQAEHFEEAQRLRDLINLMRGGATYEDAMRADTSELSRQKPGSMGIGTNIPRPVKPEGWRMPKKPDLLTSGKVGKGK